MISKLINSIPTKCIVWLWREVPFPRWFRDRVLEKANKNFLVGVVGFIFNDKGELLLLKHTYRKSQWGLPSGWLEHEQPDKGLVREVYEESNLRISVDRTVHTQYYTNPHQLTVYMQGTFIEGEFKPSDEVSEYGFYKMGDWPEGMSQEQIIYIKEHIEKGYLLC